jgi:general secretion pathway protein G
VTTAKCNRDPIKPSQSGGDSFSKSLVSARAAHRSRPAPNSASRATRGFSLLELMVVMSIIAIFLSIAIPTYSHSIVAARERALQSDLDLLRDSIWKYTLDKQKAPQSLDDLKKDNYIDKIPDDPMTHEPNWEVVQDDVLLSVDQQDPGVTDIHSASNGTASDGTAYSSW